jgi:hypothetical protein
MANESVVGDVYFTRWKNETSCVVLVVLFFSAFGLFLNKAKSPDPYLICTFYQITSTIK